ncbi:hypothetical protein [Sphingomonas daechungensis]|uniref:hypothetical protein n=1 Tax=Sphingomonas daechungensis TaxID=1176646 RepID=UPI003784A9E4
MVSVFRLPATLANDNEQGRLELEDVDGSCFHSLGMGVLSDGTPFLTQRGLAVLCGVENAHIGTISAQWRDEIQKPRINKIKDILARDGHTPVTAHIPVNVGGRRFFAYREEISLAILEYYAFDAGSQCQDEAKHNFRVMARMGFRAAIYQTVGYSPTREIDDQWRPFHDRLSLMYDKAPDGYFSIFKESAEVSVALGHSGVFPDDKIIPDISIGQIWSRYWCDNNLAALYGERLEYKHCYPDYFPQAACNPQPAFCYPEAVLGEFKRWLREQYIRGGKFQSYIGGQVQRKQITSEAARKALEAYSLNPQIGKRA